MNNARIAKIVLVAITSLLFASGVMAKEGADQYPNGGENWLAGAMPPPGTYFKNYFGYYSGTLRDGDGDKVSGASVSAWFDALRVIHVTDKKFLGANYTMHAIIPFAHQRMKLGGRASASGLGDIIVSPAVLAWHSGNWHWVAALDFYLPTGKYKSGDSRKSIGANYFSVEPAFAVTWLSPDGWEISGKFMYNIKSKNKSFRPELGAPKMDYKSGDEFHMDYLVGKRFGPWGVGVSGYYVKQTTNDELDGRKISSSLGPWSSGRKGEAFAIGPSLSYTNSSGMTFVAQWQHETYAKNRFRGDKAWFKLIIPL